MTNLLIRIKAFNPSQVFIPVGPCILGPGPGPGLPPPPGGGGPPSGGWGDAGRPFGENFSF